MAEETNRQSGVRFREPGGNNRDGPQRVQGGGIPWSFYYGNILNDDKKAANLYYDTLNSLEPFRELLRSLLDNSNYISQISADISKVESNLVLLRKFSLIRIKVGMNSEYRVPEGFFYIIRLNTDPDGDFEITNRNGSVHLTSDDLIDYYNSYAVFRLDAPISDKKLTLYFGDDMDIVEPRLVDYAHDFKAGRIRIESDSGIEDVDYNDNVIRTSVSDSSIRFFGKIESNKIGSGMVESAYKFNNGANYTLIKPDLAIIFDRDVKSVKANGDPIGYEKVEISEYPSILGDPNIVALGHNLVARSGATISNNQYNSNYGAEFGVSQMEGLRYRFRVGTFIQLTDNDSYQSDVFGSSSFFFREEIERLSDVANADVKKNRIFRIGSRYENLNIIEIVEEYDNGKLKKVTDLPDQLYLVSNPFQTIMQNNAVNSLLNSPSLHHLNLLPLMRSGFRWQDIDTSRVPIDQWYVLTNDSYDGVDAQREMVRRSLCTTDFAFLEGPPGSGKTTTILEIIAQMVMRDKKVLLAASTHAAIDNILERLDKLPEQVRNRLLVARIGNEGSVGDNVLQYLPTNIYDADIQELVYRNANLVCGTTFGILKHPDFNLRDKARSKYLSPLYDCLIIDEASKTTFQDFLVPAVFARKWILSGDIKQLTPYVESSDVATSIRSMKKFDLQHQEIYGLIQNLVSDIRDLKGYRFTIPVGQAVIADLSSMIPSDINYLCIAESSSDDCITPLDIINGTKESMLIYGVDLIFIDRELLKQLSDYLPASNILINDYSGENNRYIYYSNHYYSDLKKRGRSKVLFFDRDRHEGAEQVRDGINALIRKADWAGQIAWRISRQQELFMLKDISSGNTTVRHYQEDIDRRIPDAYREEIDSYLNLLRELSMPSILQLLKQGVAENAIKSKHERKNTTLNRGFGDDYDCRCTCLDYQNRMHRDISKFSREHIYGGEALKDNEKLNREWGCKMFKNHAVWENVETPKSCNNDNPYEAGRIANLISKFAEFARENPNKNDPEGIWTIAVLTYYKRQEETLKRILTESANVAYGRSFRLPDYNLHVEIFTVDKYQGKEADLVFISMVKSSNGKGVSLGFMDSPNRLNVALTRARFQRVIVGNRDYFLNQSNSPLLRKLAEESQ
ncbi:MAG: AAA domain-containing protein [Candidatus Methanomethylophilaceae archaeon]|jgi:hypothetical protein|nr:AAA domain-containing protein [Candidatus Methanomethylophilaceae archaeon]